MKSLCFKNNNAEIISYLIDRFSTSNIDSLCISNKKFKLYNNVIIHYSLDNCEFFYDRVSSILTECIIEFYELKLLKRILEYNYFYFSSQEKRQILKDAKDFIANDDITRDDTYFSIYYQVLDYIKNNKSVVIEGLVNFRLQNYMKDLDYAVDICVNKFLIEKEYNEFVNILKLYVSITPCNASIVHLIYHNGDSILLDEEKNIIKVDDNVFKAKYLSDITFSSNDYALNTLLSIVPKKLIIHLVQGKEDDKEFINTLKLIFEDRCEICTECAICNLYKRAILTK